MIKLLIIIVLGLTVCVAAKFSTGETIADKKRCRDFILERNPIEGQRIFNAILNYRRGFPVCWLTALICGESGFDPETHEADDDKGLGQLTPIALREIERVYSIVVDDTRVFEIEYNVYLTGLFAERCKAVAVLHDTKRYKIFYATIMVYKDWLTWTDWTHTKADRTWKIYQELKYDNLTHKYESEMI